MQSMSSGRFKFTIIGLKLIAFVEEFNFLAPFGEGNRPPVIGVKQVYVKNVKPIGNKLQHLKFTLYQDKHSVDAIAFNQARLADVI